MAQFSSFHKLRVIICLVAWLALFASYSQRVNLSIGIIGMVTEKPLKINGNSSCPIRRHSESHSKVEGLTIKHDWDEKLQNYLLLAYNIGYMMGHVPGAFFSLYFGSRAVMLFSLISSTLLTLVSVYFVELKWTFFAIRMLIGFVNGPLYPLVHETIANHAPPEERTALTMLTHTGNLASLMLILPLGGLFIENFQDGWKYIFYVSVAFGVIATVLWAIFVYSEPEENPLMSKFERDLITNSIYPDGKPEKSTIWTVPFRAIFTSRHLYVFTSVHFGKLLILYMNLFGIVKYLYKYYNLSPLMAGNLAVVPFVADFLFQMVYSHIVTLMKKTEMEITPLRKLNTFIGAFGSASFLIALGFVSCHNLVLGIILMTLCSMFLAPFQAGYFTAIIEFAPQYAGTIYSFVNVGGTFSGVAQRYLTAYLSSRIPDIREAYRYSFWITGAVTFVLSMVYVIFGTAELQPWAKTGRIKKIPLTQNERITTEKV